MDSLRLCQLVCSRLCHDLITPVGAINNGIEIITETPEAIDQELLTLTHQSAKNTSARLIYYRSAFGFAGAQLFSSPQKIFQILNDYLQNANIKFDWPIDHLNGYDELVSKYGRLILNLVGVIMQSAPFGGKLRLEVDPICDHGTLNVKCILEGDLFALKKEIRACLYDQMCDEDVTSQSVQAYLTYLYMKKLNLNVITLSSNRSSLNLNIGPRGMPKEKSGTLL